jgi:hypothetical protein
MTARKQSTPYASASSGDRARNEIIKLLRRFGCEKIGILDDLAKHEVMLYFEHRGRQVQMPVSAKGWAAMYLRANPWHSGMRRSRHEHEQAALHQGHIAVSSILRDGVKSDITRIESGAFSFEAMFLPYMLTNDGRPVIERIGEGNLLPAPDDKVVPLR